MERRHLVFQAHLAEAGMRYGFQIFTSRYPFLFFNSLYTSPILSPKENNRIWILQHYLVWVFQA
jgi:hypothetical protein